MILFEIETTKPLAKLRDDLPRACADHKFGVLGVIDLREKLKEKGLDYPRGAVVFEVCNPHQAKRVLDARPEVSTALPCRISAYEAPDGKTRLATLRPTDLIGLFGAGAAPLAAVAREVEETLVAIMKQAASA
jgi:uncharacterized protein (DUF302 family)